MLETERGATYRSISLGDEGQLHIGSRGFITLDTGTEIDVWYPVVQWHSFDQLGQMFDVPFDDAMREQPEGTAREMLTAARNLLLEIEFETGQIVGMPNDYRIACEEFADAVNAAEIDIAYPSDLPDVSDSGELSF